jgi:hypothetical protein
LSGDFLVDLAPGDRFEADVRWGFSIEHRKWSDD